MECITYCYNEKCNKKYKCKRYRDFNNLEGRDGNRKNFTFSKA